MPAEFPYLYSIKNLPDILARVKQAGTPPRFTNEFLQASLGFQSSADRPVIAVFKKLGFLTDDGTPTARYNEFRDATKSGQAMAAGLREGWSQIFLADQRAHEKSATQLKELFKNVSGKADAVAEKMASTFKALAAVANWTAEAAPEASAPAAAAAIPEASPRSPVRQQTSIGLHHDVHIHLPPTSDVAVYTAIFRALREELL
jgi:hypothetical protein